MAGESDQTGLSPDNLGTESFEEGQKLAQSVRDARPSFLDKGGFSPKQDEDLFSTDRRYGKSLFARQTDASIGSVRREPRQPFFPETIPEQITQVSGVARGNISFQILDRSTSDDGNRVLIQDGKINGVFPAGMGTGDYILDLSNPGDTLIYAGATFNPASLQLTSHFLGISGSGDFPESRIDENGGFLYWQLGFTYFNPAGAFTIWQTRLGEIKFDFAYGAVNGQPAVLPIDSAPGWLSLDVDA